MRYRSEKFILMFISICLVFCGCSDKEERRSDFSIKPPSDEKIVETNKIREEYGIRQIKKNWSFSYREFGIERWKDERNFPCKSVRYDKNYEQIISEHDYYHTGRRFPSLDPDGGTSSEHLTIAYDYVRRRFAVIPTTDNKGIIHMIDPLKGHIIELGYTGETNEQALDIADKILKMWGLKRL